MAQEGLCDRLEQQGPKGTLCSSSPARSRCPARGQNLPLQDLTRETTPGSNQFHPVSHKPSPAKSLGSRVFLISEMTYPNTVIPGQGRPVGY
eukprot:762850-Hanusia_phi.AAC.1